MWGSAVLDGERANDGITVKWPAFAVVWISNGGATSTQRSANSTRARCAVPGRGVYVLEITDGQPSAGQVAF